MIRLDIVLCGYNENHVKIATQTIEKNAEKYNVLINSAPLFNDKLLKRLPKYHGTESKDLTVVSIRVTGLLADIKELIKSRTPKGVMIDLLPIIFRQKLKESK